MGIAVVIVVGMVIMTVVAAGFDFLTKKDKSSSSVSATQVKDLEERIKILEINESERTEQLKKIQDEVKFMNKLLLEDKSGTGEK